MNKYSYFYSVGHLMNLIIEVLLQYSMLLLLTDVYFHEYNSL